MQPQGHNVMWNAEGWQLSYQARQCPDSVCTGPVAVLHLPNPALQSCGTFSVFLLCFLCILSLFPCMIVCIV